MSLEIVNEIGDWWSYKGKNFPSGPSRKIANPDSIDEEQDDDDGIAITIPDLDDDFLEYDVTVSYLRNLPYVIFTGTSNKLRTRMATIVLEKGHINGYCDYKDVDDLFHWENDGKNRCVRYRVPQNSTDRTAQRLRECKENAGIAFDYDFFRSDESIGISAVQKQNNNMKFKWQLAFLAAIKGNNDLMSAMSDCRP